MAEAPLDVQGHSGFSRDPHRPVREWERKRKEGMVSDATLPSHSQLRRAIFSCRLDGAIEIPTLFGTKSSAARSGLFGANSGKRRASPDNRRRCRHGHNGTAITEQPMNQPAAWLMIRRRATAAGITAPIGDHTFRAPGLTNFFENGGTLEAGQDMAAHSSPRTTKLYNRRRQRIRKAEVERVRL
ncbi:MAG: tyrosine-type recombinase/integrase [Patescibacteria group bacterium]|nr:tyrosine-type recombinase/integrase [Patescibacteria group bacterium]